MKLVRLFIKVTVFLDVLTLTACGDGGAEGTVKPVTVLSWSGSIYSLLSDHRPKLLVSDR